ncbi:MAG: LysR substrate-binding domain-containing protein [Nocardioides sp.]
MSALARLDGDVADLREGRTGSLSLQSIQSAGETWLPVVGQRLIAELPDVLLTLAISDDAPEGAEIDLQVATEDPSQAPGTTPGLRRHHLLTEAYSVVMPVGHPLAEHDQVPLPALGGHALIDDDLHDSTCGLILRRCYRAAGFTPRYVARVTDHHAAQAFVAAGIGACVLPDLTLTHPPDRVVVRPLVDPTPRRTIVALVRESVEASPPVARALQILREVAAG